MRLTLNCEIHKLIHKKELPQQWKVSTVLQFLKGQQTWLYPGFYPHDLYLNSPVILG
jgi:hypothetical protein